MYKIININIFFRPEEAMFENWQNLVSAEKFVLILRKSKIHAYYCLWSMGFLHAL